MVEPVSGEREGLEERLKVGVARIVVAIHAEERGVLLRDHPSRSCQRRRAKHRNPQLQEEPHALNIARQRVAMTGRVGALSVRSDDAADVSGSWRSEEHTS